MKVYFNGTIVRETEESISSELITADFLAKVKDMLKSDYPNIEEATSSVDSGDIYFTVTPKTKGC